MNGLIIIIFVLILFMFSVWGMEEERIESIKDTIETYLELDGGINGLD